VHAGLPPSPGELKMQPRKGQAPPLASNFPPNSDLQPGVLSGRHVPLESEATLGFRPVPLCALMCSVSGTPKRKFSLDLIPSLDP
jgi:hypothetical protein